MFIFTFLGKVLVGFSYHYINILSSILYSIIMVISGRSRGETWGPAPPYFCPKPRPPPIFFKTAPLPLSQSLDDRPPLLIWRSESATGYSI